MIKKLIAFILIIVGCFSLFLFLYHKETNYVYTYEVDGYQITERYSKKDKTYNFVVNKEKLVFTLPVKEKYSYQRGLINQVNIENKNGIVCLKLDGLINIYPICKKNDEYLTYFDKLKENEKVKVFQKINIYDLNNRTFLLWNYHGFNYINKDKEQEINILTKDVYNPDLIKILDGYLFVPNYDQKYFFNSYYLINIKNGKVLEKKLKSDLSYDLIYTEDTSKHLKIYDKKVEKEFILEYKKGNITHNKGVKYKASELLKFNKVKNYFISDDKTLYYYLGDFKLKIVEMEVKDIIYQNEYEVYFLSKDVLYYFNLYTGLSKTLMNNEWSFNYKDVIYIY